MIALRNQWEIMSQALALVQRHRKLLLLPLCNLLGIASVLALFATPLLIPLESWDHASVKAALESWGDEGNRTVQMLILYVVILAMLTLINSAFYHAIIQAYNGGSVSIRQGFSLTLSKLPALLQWSLLAGLVGAFIRLLEDTVGGFARWVYALLGVSWSVASMFVLPVLLRESAFKSPPELLRISVRLIKQRWGEGLGAVVSFRLMAALVLVGGTVAGVFVLFGVGNLILPPESDALQLWRALSVVAAVLLSFLGAQFILLLQHVYICGLYIFACEGVIPAIFEERTFDSGWFVK